MLHFENIECFANSCFVSEMARDVCLTIQEKNTRKNLRL